MQRGCVASCYWLQQCVLLIQMQRNVRHLYMSRSGISSSYEFHVLIVTSRRHLIAHWKLGDGTLYKLVLSNNLYETTYKYLPGAENYALSLVYHNVKETKKLTKRSGPESRNSQKVRQVRYVSLTDECTSAGGKDLSKRYLQNRGAWVRV